MSSNPSKSPAKRKRSTRVSTLKLPPGTFEKAWGTIRRSDVLGRIALCLLTALLVWSVTGGWAPPLAFRVGDIPARNVVARVTFERVDDQATSDARQAARRIADCVYVHDPRPLRELQQALKDKIFQLRAANSYDDVDKTLWADFTREDTEQEQQVMLDLDALTSLSAAAVQQSGLPAISGAATSPATRMWRKRKEFADFKQAFADDPNLTDFSAAISRSLSSFNDHGLIESLQHEIEQGNHSRIRIYTVGDQREMRPFEVDQVRIGQVLPRLEANLSRELPSPAVAKKIYAWLAPKLPTTLTFDAEATRVRADLEIASMPPVMTTFKQDETVLARANEAITPEVLAVLADEHSRYKSQMSTLQLVYLTLSKFGMYCGLYTLCGFYIFFRHRRLLNDVVSLVKLMTLVLATVTAAYFAAPARFELIPLLIFSMVVVILYQQELALLLSACMAFLITLTLDFSLVELVTILASMSTTVLLLRHVRSRTKLIYVALWT
ncbi:MAG: hypothetical protein KDB23_29120, partial [Planctomycetales bacterium]|nr:hypothetical protein [Planctomycetales bacterium]